MLMGPLLGQFIHVLVYVIIIYAKVTSWV